jgi:O-antigen/teichoic acid export membrane protein
MGLAFVPAYIKYLGIEAYGLIGLFGILQAWLVLLDLGMSPTLSREMARFKGGSYNVDSIRDLLRSVEIVAIIIAGLIGVFIWSSSTWLATDWLHANNFPVEMVANVFCIMGVVTSLRFIESIYRNAILGLQKQVAYNLVNALLATIRALGALGVLIWISPTITAFFIWQIIISLVSLGVFCTMTYGALPEANRNSHFSLSILKEIRYFATGVMGITFLAILLTQIDKILLSRLLNLEEYGYYTLAAVVASALNLLVTPIIQAVSPLLNELHAKKRESELIEKYHQGAQLVSVFMGSASIILILNSEIILNLWTGNNELAANSAYLLSILSFGNLLNGLMWVPHQTQLAYGWTSLALRINIVSVIIIVPLIIVITPVYGAEGAAWLWVAINAGYLTIGKYFMYQKILRGEKWLWYKEDVLVPIFIALIIAVILHMLMPISKNYVFNLIWILLSSCITVIASICSASKLRFKFIIMLKNYKNIAVKW